MATAEHADVRLDEHGIRPIPAADRDSTPWQQFWIWAGANIAPINWILGALGIILGLSLVETIAVLIVGNLVGCAFFGLFCVMGHRTGVNQMVLSRAAFGRRGAYLPAVVQMLMTMGWLGVNTWVVLDLVLGIFEHMGYDHPGTGTKYAVGIAIMAIQVVIAIVGFYLIQTFEKYTVPVAAVIVLLMTILAYKKVDVVWSHSTAHGSDKLTAVTQLMTAIGVGWGITWLTWSSDYTRFIRPATSDRKVFLSCARRSSSRRSTSASSAPRSRAPARAPTRPTSSPRRSGPPRSRSSSSSCTGRSRRTSSTSTRRASPRCRST